MAPHIYWSCPTDNSTRISISIECSTSPAASLAATSRCLSLCCCLCRAGFSPVKIYSQFEICFVHVCVHWIRHGTSRMNALKLVFLSRGVWGWREQIGFLRLSYCISIKQYSRSHLPNRYLVSTTHLHSSNLSPLWRWYFGWYIYLFKS